MGTKRYKRDFKALERRRHKAAQLLSRGMPQAEVARRVGVSRQSVSVWARALAEDKQAWRRKALGVPAALDVAARKRLCQLLLQGAVANGYATELWTLQRIVEVIKREFGVAYCKTNVWLLLKDLGFSCQRPTGRARQRDEKAIGEWKHNRWPMLKKSPQREEKHFLH
jgi:putative transposase